jgi:hypothetical protein
MQPELFGPTPALPTYESDVGRRVCVWNGDDLRIGQITAFHRLSSTQNVERSGNSQTQGSTEKAEREEDVWAVTWVKISAQPLLAS